MNELDLSSECTLDRDLSMPTQWFFLSLVTSLALRNNRFVFLKAQIEPKPSDVIIDDFCSSFASAFAFYGTQFTPDVS